VRHQTSRHESWFLSLENIEFLPATQKVNLRTKEKRKNDVTMLSIACLPRMIALHPFQDASHAVLVQVCRGSNITSMPSDVTSALESDEALLQQAGRGDTEAFGRLYDRMSPPLFGLLKQILNDEKEAEDVLQEGFVTLWKKASSYDSSRSKAFTWAVMIFRNKAIDKLRSKGRLMKVTEAAKNELVLLTQETASITEHEINRTERAVLLRNALQLIPEQQRRLIEYSFLNGDTHETIAERLKMPLGTVKTNIRRGMLRLRDLMKGGES